MTDPVNLQVEIGSLTLKNPVLTASGTFGYGLEFEQFFDISLLGGFCTKGLSLEPMAGTAPGRIHETPAGMLNAIGLENVGVEGFVKEKLPRLEHCECHIVANVLGKTLDEFKTIARRLDPYPQVSALELNISCPNIKEGGIEFGHDPHMTFAVTEAVRNATSKPVWVKLSPNVTDIRLFALACQDAGADAISLVNTFVGMSIDVNKRRPMLSNTTGGLSGPAIRPLAVRMAYRTFVGMSIDVNKRRPMLSNTTGGLSGPAIRPLAVRMAYEASQVVSIPIVGMGGISTARDALEFLLAGASAVQIGTANFYDPTVAIKVIEGLREYCVEQGIQDINEIVGSLEVREGQFFY